MNQALRTQMITKLRAQKKEEAQAISLKIMRKLFRLKFFKQAKTVMFYIAHDGEVQTRRMIEEAVKLGKNVAVPTCDIKTRKIIPCLLTGLEKKHFQKGAYDIHEPLHKKPIDSKKIDVVIVPGLAFDFKGNRLGRGMGYYDRFLDAVPEDTPKVGLAYKFQVLKKLPACMPHDIRVDKVLFA